MGKRCLLCCSLLAAILICQPLSIEVFNSKTVQTGACNMDGTILYVGGSGPGNYTMIQQAVNAAEDGDTIYVYDDSSPYHEHLIISDAILLQGENQTTTVIDGNKTRDVITVNANNMTIQGFTVKNSGDDWPRCAGIKLHADNALVSNITFQYTQAGVILTASSDSLINECTFRYNEVGVYLENSSSSNHITNNSMLSYSFDYQVAVVSSPYNTVEGNTITNPDNFGIYVYDSPGTHLRDNTVTNCEEGIVFVSSNSSDITDNILQNNTVYGISMGTCTDCIVSDNTFTHDGLFLYQCYSNTITGNIVNGAPLICLEGISDQTVSQDAGQIILVNCTKVTIKNTAIQNVCIAIQCWSCQDCSITENTLMSNLCGIYLSDCSNTDVSSNNLSDSRWEIFLHLMYIDYCDQTTVTDNDFTFADEFTSIYFANSQTVVFSQNTLNGFFEDGYTKFCCGYSKDIIITDNTVESGGIGLSVCTKATLQGNTLQSGNIGLRNSNNVHVLRNDIHPQSGSCGIILEETMITILRDNTITQGTGAVSLTSCLLTRVMGNSFVDCGDEPAAFTNCIRNTWVHNYWGGPLLHLKIIHGKIQITYGFPPRGFTIPVINLDKTPKLIP